MIMESAFSFAYDNPHFSDRRLRIEGIENFRHSNIDNHDEGEMLTSNPLPLGVTELHISSAILASKSPFFYKLFSNGTTEPKQRNVTLKIDASEEVSVMELVKFMYTNSLSVTTVPALLDVLMAANKYEVASCTKYCSRVLLDLPMTVDFALRVLDLPPTILAFNSVIPLMNAAKRFLTSHYKDISKFPIEEVMALPLVGIETILASNDLEIDSEDALYDLALNWVKTHYSDLQQRQNILGFRLARFIRFPSMACSKLVEILKSDDISNHHKSEAVINALLYKEDSRNRQRVLTTQQQSFTTYPWGVERVYKYKPIQIVEFEIPRPQSIVYFDLTRKECQGLYPSGRLYSDLFKVGGQRFRLYAECLMEPLDRFNCFGLFLEIQVPEPESLTLDYKLSARTNLTGDFLEFFRGPYKFTRGMDAGNVNFLGIPWGHFLAMNSPYFINDIVHLRAEFSILH